MYGDQQQFAQMNLDYTETVDKNNRRIEIRRCWAVADPLALEYIRHDAGWADLQTSVRIQGETRLNGETSSETADYLSSLPNRAAQLLEATRHHWAIENSFHWVLDVTFREDDPRIRVGDRPQNMAVLRHLALNILKRDTSKASLQQKRFRAGLEADFLFHLLTQV